MPVEVFGKLTHKLFKIMDDLDETVGFLDLTARFTLDALGLAGLGNISKSWDSFLPQQPDFFVSDLQASILMLLRIVTTFGLKNITASMLPCGTHYSWSRQRLSKNSSGHSQRDKNGIRTCETFWACWMESSPRSVKSTDRNSSQTRIRKPETKRICWR